MEKRHFQGSSLRKVGFTVLGRHNLISINSHFYYAFSKNLSLPKVFIVLENDLLKPCRESLCLQNICLQKYIYLLMNLLLFSSFFYVSLIICPPSISPRMIFFVTQQEFMVLSPLFQVNSLSWPSVFLFSPAYFFFQHITMFSGPTNVFL